MISKFPGTCTHCHKPTKAGVDQYNVEEKVSYHVSCQQDFEDHPQLSLEHLAIAEQCSFIQWRPGMGTDGLLRSVSETRGGLAAWGLESASHRRQEYTLRSGDEIDSVRPEGING